MEGGGPERGFVDLSGAVVTLGQFGDAAGVDVDAPDLEMAGERDGKRQADIAQTDDDKLHTRSFAKPD
jgi:hypothetical protein